MNLPSHQDFLSSLNSRFQLLITQDLYEILVLKSVTELRESPASTPTHPKEQFSIIFESESPDYHPQQIYSFDHPIIGQFDLFIVPIGPDNVSKNMCYQAIFN